MQQMKSWRFWMVVGVLGLSSITTPATAQQPAASSAPAAGADAKTCVDKGMSNGAKGDLATAISAFDQAITIDPKYAPAYYNRGFAYSLEGNVVQAISNYDQTIRLDPTYKAAYYQRGSLKGQEGNFDDAISDFSEVIKLDPKYAPAYYNRGHVQYFKGDLDDALTEINHALTLDPNFPFSYFIRGLVLHAQGHREDATADFKKGAEFNFPYAAYWVWITEMEAKQPEVACRDLTDSLNNPEMFKTTDPNDWTSEIANFLLQKITRGQMMAKAKTANPIETNGRLCEAWFYAGMSALLSGDARDARECFTQAVATGSKGSEEYIEANRELTELPQPPAP